MPKIAQMEMKTRRKFFTKKVFERVVMNSWKQIILEIRKLMLPKKNIGASKKVKISKTIIADY
jgi:hypothetical protein